MRDHLTRPATSTREPETVRDIVEPKLKKRMEATLRLAPRHAGAHHVLGELLWQLPGFLGGSQEGAERELEAALASDPSYTAPYPTLAELYIKVGRKAEAKELLDRVLKVEKPADPAEYKEHVADLRKALKAAR